MKDESKSNIIYVNFFTKQKVETQEEVMSRPESLIGFDNVVMIRDQPDFLTNGEIKGINYRIDQILIELDTIKSLTQAGKVLDLEAELSRLNKTLGKKTLFSVKSR